MKKLLLFIILLPTILMADAVIFSGNDVKALKQNLDLFGVVKVMSGAVDPSAGAGVAAPQGSAYLSTVHGLFLKTGVANTAWTKNSLLPVDLTSQVTGVLPVTNGGTNSSTALSNGKTIYSNAGALVESTINPKDAIRTLSSGVVSGGVVSINADPTKFDITAGSGTITDNWTDPSNPVVYNVSWTSQTAIPATYVGTDTFSYVGINTAGAVVQYDSSITNSQRRDIIVLVKLAHSNLTSIQNIVNSYDAIQSPTEQLRDTINALRFVNTGNTISANGANLKINKSIGTLFGKGINYPANLKDPNSISIASQVAATFQYRTQTGVASANTTDLAVGSYDVGGTVTAIPGVGSISTNQRVYLFPNGNIRIQYGQRTYSNLAAAVQGLSSETFVTFSNIQESAVLVGIISVRKGATALNSTTDAIFIPVSKFGEFNIGASGTPTTTLQQAYLNSTSPQVTTNATQGSFDVATGAGIDTNNALTVKNNAGTVNFSVTGEGRVSGKAIDSSFPIQDSSDPTKQITFDAAGTTGTLTTIQGSQTANRLITLPDLTTTLVGTTGTQTISDKTFVAPILGNATGTSLALGGTINANAIADFQSTTKAFIPPRMTTTQRNAMTASAGMIVYNSTDSMLQFYNGSAWINTTPFSFRVTTTTGTVTENYGNLISSCTAANPTVCTFNSNKFTGTPNCSSGVISSNAFVRLSSISSSGITIETQNASGGGVPNTPAMIICHGN